jgi:uncharacterized protein (DUF1697 family)
MPRYAAFLRGVSPQNAKMPALKHAFEGAGFTNVRTLLSSGNVVFDSALRSASTIQRTAEDAMQAHLDRRFSTFIRPLSALQTLIDTDPFASFQLPPNAKCVVTFLRTPFTGALSLPIRHQQAAILQVRGTETLCAYVPDAQGPVFMHLLERTFGTDITTRTLETVRKCARATS